MIRLSVVAGNVRVQRVIDAMTGPGATIVDVGANTGYNTLYAAARVGPQGRVYAVEPAQDNLAVLYANVLANRLTNVTVLPFAAGAAQTVATFFLRGETSAVNSFYRDNFYAPVTGSTEVAVAPLDDLVGEYPDLVKIDVEGAELEVLAGMARLLRSRRPRLIVEWHPLLQQAAGCAPDALPRQLMAQGFTLHAVTNVGVAQVETYDLAALTGRLLRAGRPVELLAVR
jgi:FkbM family methyltransferase